MSDIALIDWLAGGCKVTVPAEEDAARRAQAFSLRFFQAMNPQDDLGPTEEDHQMAIAHNVHAVHVELNALGNEAYSDVWQTLSARHRSAIKTYVAMVKK